MLCTEPGTGEKVYSLKQLIVLVEKKKRKQNFIKLWYIL